MTLGGPRQHQPQAVGLEITNFEPCDPAQPCAGDGCDLDHETEPIAGDAGIVGHRLEVVGGPDRRRFR
jgi:hypothetical protein